MLRHDIRERHKRTSFTWITMICRGCRCCAGTDDARASPKGNDSVAPNHIDVERAISLTNQVRRRLDDASCDGYFLLNLYLMSNQSAVR